MKYIVYQTVNKVNNKIYIGVHSTVDPNKFDGYIGCGVDIFRPATYQNPKTPFQFAVRKYGVKNFVRSIISTFDNEEDAYNLEALLVNEDFVRRDDVYNLALGGKFHEQCANPKKEIHMYDLDGNYIRSFDSINEAALTINPNAKNGSHISRAIKCGYVYQEHQWSYEKVPYMKKVKARKPKSFNTINSPKVGRYDTKGNLLETFENLTACRKAGYTNANKVLEGLRDHCKGYVFKYLD